MILLWSMPRLSFSCFDFISGVSLLATLIGGLKHLFSYFDLGWDAQASSQPFCFLFWVLALLATLIGGLNRLFSYFALGQDAQACFQPFCFSFWVLAFSYPHRRAQASFQLFCSRPGCSGVFLAILHFISGVSLLATLIGGLKCLFNYFALGRDAQASFQPFCILFWVLAC